MKHYYCLNASLLFTAYQIENLLTGDENETIKNAFIDFSRDRNIDIMLFALYPILGAEEKMSLWQFVIFCLTPNEEKLFRKRLFDLVNIQLPKGKYHLHLSVKYFFPF